MDNCPERMHSQDKILFRDEALAGLALETAVDNCPERVNVVDTEASLPLRVWTGVALEAVLALEAVVVLEADAL